MARRRHSNRRRRGGSIGFLYKLLSMLVICVAVVVALTLFFRVDTILVTGAERYTEEEVRAATQVETGDNLILMSKPTVVKHVTSALPYVESIRINRKLPDLLLVEIRECREPLALIQDGRAWLISPRGSCKIVDEKLPSDTLEYPRIEGCRLVDPAVGENIILSTEYEGQQQSLVDLLHALADSGMLSQVNGIQLSNLSTLTMLYAGGRFRVELPYNADYDYKLRALEAVVGKLETNQTGTIQLTREDGRINFVEETRKAPPETPPEPEETKK